MLLASTRPSPTLARMREGLLGVLWGTCVVCVAFACSGEKEPASPSDGGTTSTATSTGTVPTPPEPSAAGGAGGRSDPGTGGDGAGGKGGGDSGGPATGEKCGPGNVGTDEAAFCGGYQPMTIPGDPNLVVASALPRESLVGGQPYVVSVEVFSHMPTIEIWGANAKCGDGLELLASIESATGTHCLTLEPSASYSHLLTVLRGPDTNGALVGWDFCGAAGYCGE